jgi:hypothetical protein
VVDCLCHLRHKSLVVIEATPVGAEAWRRHIQDIGEHSLLPLADLWYMGANIPGKQRELLSYFSVREYMDRCEDSARNGYEGFVLR